MVGSIPTVKMEAGKRNRGFESHPIPLKGAKMIQEIQKEYQEDLFEFVIPLFLSKFSPEELAHFNALFDEFYWDKFEKYDDLTKLKNECIKLAVLRIEKQKPLNPGSIHDWSNGPKLKKIGDSEYELI